MLELFINPLPVSTRLNRRAGRGGFRPGLDRGGGWLTRVTPAPPPPKVTLQIINFDTLMQRLR
jgi:hypothetical protein